EDLAHEVLDAPGRREARVRDDLVDHGSQRRGPGRVDVREAVVREVLEQAARGPPRHRVVHAAVPRIDVRVAEDDLGDAIDLDRALALVDVADAARAVTAEPVRIVRQRRLVDHLWTAVLLRIPVELVREVVIVVVELRLVGASVVPSRERTRDLEDVVLIGVVALAVQVEDAEGEELLQLLRMNWFCFPMSFVSKTLENAVAKWSCQKSVSFSFRPDFAFSMYLSQLLCWRNWSLPAGLKAFGLNATSSSAPSPRVKPWASQRVTTLSSAPKPLRRKRCRACARSSSVLSPISSAPHRQHWSCASLQLNRSRTPIRCPGRRPRSRAPRCSAGTSGAASGGTACGRRDRGRARPRSCGRGSSSAGLPDLGSRP